MLKADINTKLIQLCNVLLVIKKRLVSTIGIQYCDLNRFFFGRLWFFIFPTLQQTFLSLLEWSLQVRNSRNSPCFTIVRSTKNDLRLNRLHSRSPWHKPQSSKFALNHLSKGKYPSLSSQSNKSAGAYKNLLAIHKIPLGKYCSSHFIARTAL